MLNERSSLRSLVSAVLERRDVEDMARAALASMRIKFGLPVPRLDEHAPLPSAPSDDRGVVDRSKTSSEDQVC